ncbi:MAG: cupin domain-containing protein [Acetobacteraceae bacterium]
MRIAATTLAILLAGTTAASADTAHTDILAGPSAVKWGPAPPVLPAGAQLAVIAGDPSKPGPFVLRLRMPADYRIAAHHHPTIENVTVLAGSFHAGMGDRLDRDKGSALQPGGFVSLPANMNHYAWTAAETIVQVHGDGPFQLVYVDPADDPTRK